MKSKEIINDIVDLKRYINSYAYDYYIVNIDGLLMAIYKKINVYLSPYSICLMNDECNYICIDGVEYVEFENDIIKVYTNWIGYYKYVYIKCCQYK